MSTGSEESTRKVAVVAVTLLEEVTGLCVNCASREACRLRAGQTRIWFCEEYR